MGDILEVLVLEYDFAGTRTRKSSYSLISDSDVMFVPKEKTRHTNNRLYQCYYILPINF